MYDFSFSSLSNNLSPLLTNLRSYLDSTVSSDQIILHLRSPIDSKVLLDQFPVSTDDKIVSQIVDISRSQGTSLVVLADHDIKWDGVSVVAVVPLHYPVKNQEAFIYGVFVYAEMPDTPPDDISLADSLSHSVWQAYQMQVLIEFGMKVNDDLPKQDVILAYMQTYIGKLIDISHFLSINLYIPAQNKLICYAIKDGEADQDIIPESSMTGWILNVYEEPIFIEHYDEIYDTLREQMDPYEPHLVDTKTQSIMFVPLKVGNRTQGIISVQYPEPDHYTLSDFRILQLFGNHLEVALEHHRSVEAVSILHHSWQNFNEAGSLPDNWKRIHDADELHSEWYTLPISVQIEWINNQIYATRTTLLLDVGGTQQLITSDDDVTYPPLLSDSIIVEHLKSIGDPIWQQDVAQLNTSLQAYMSDEFDFSATLYDEEDEVVRSVVLFPFKLMKNTEGILLIEYNTSQLFDNIQRSVITSMVTLLSSSIRQFDATKQRKLLISLMNEVNYALNRELDVDHTLFNIVESAPDFVSNAEIILVALYDMDDETKFVNVYPAPEQTHGLSLERADYEVLLTALESKQAVRHPSPLESDVAVLDGMRAFIAVPIMSESEELGFIGFISPYQDAFHNEDLDLLDALASRSATAIQNARLHERHKYTTQQIVEVQQKMVNALDVASSHMLHQEFYDSIIEGAEALTDADYIQLLMDFGDQINDGKGTYGLRQVAANQYAQDRLEELGGENIERLIPLENSAVGEVFRLAETDSRPLLRILNVDRSPHYHRQFDDVASGLYVPLMQSDSRPIGVLCLEGTQPDQFDNYDEQIMILFSQMAVVGSIYHRNITQMLSVQKLHDQWAKIEKLSVEISNTQDFINTIYQALRNIAEHFDADEAFVLTFNEGTRLLKKFDWQANAQEQEPETYYIHADNDFTDLERHIVEGLTKDLTPSTSRNFLLKFLPNKLRHSEMTLPLSVSSLERPLGAIYVRKNIRLYYIPEDHDLLEIFGTQITLAIVKSRETERWIEQKQFREKVQSLANKLSYGYAYDEIITTLNKELHHNENPDDNIHYLVHIYNHASKTLELHDEFKRDLPEDYQHLATIPLGVGVIGAVADAEYDSSGVYIPDTQLDPTYEDDETTLGKTMFVQRIAPDKHLFGVFTAYSTGEFPYAFNLQRREYFEGIITQIDIAITRIRKLERERHHRRQLEEERLMSSFGAVAMNLAHRLGNDLGPVPTYLDFARDEIVKAVTNTDDLQKIDEQLHIAYEKMNRALNRITIIKEDLTRITADLPKPNDIDLNQLVRPLARQYRHDTNIEVNLPSVKVYVDQVQIQDAIHNIIQNAIEEIDSTEGLIRITGSEDMDYGILYIADNGGGILPKHQDNVFKLLYTTKDNGSGFGLWSTNRSVIINRGILTFETGSDGTTFIMKLPKLPPQHQFEDGGNNS